MVFYNPASLLPRPEVAVNPAPRSNEGFVIGAALKEIGDLVRKKADVEALRTEANQYANYAESRGNTSIAQLLRDRSSGYSLLTDPNQERSSLLKGVTTLTELEENERRNDLVNAVAKYDNLQDDKLRALQSVYSNAVALRNREESLIESDYQNAKAAANKSRANDIPANDPVRRSNKYDALVDKAASDIEAYSGSMGDQVLKQEPVNPVPGSARPSGNAVPFGAQSRSVEPDLPDDAGTPFDPNATGLLLPTINVGDELPVNREEDDWSGRAPAVAPTAPEEVSVSPVVPAPGAAATTPAPVAAEPPVLPAPGVEAPPTVAAPTVPPSAPEKAAGKTEDELVFSQVPVYVDKPGVDMSIPENQAVKNNIIAKGVLVKNYNENLKDLYDGVELNKSQYLNEAAVKHAKNAYVKASKNIASIPYPPGSDEWVRSANQIMAQADNVVSKLPMYNVAQRATVEGRDNVYKFSVKLFGEQGGPSYNAEYTNDKLNGPRIKVFMPDGSMKYITGVWNKQGGFEAVNPQDQRILEVGPSTNGQLPGTSSAQSNPANPAPATQPVPVTPPQNPVTTPAPLQTQFQDILKRGLNLKAPPK